MSGPSRGGTSGRVSEAQDHPLAGGKCLERLGPEAAERLPAVSAGFDQPGGAEAADMPAHERLREADMLDEVGHAGVPEREALDDPEAVHVGERLVDDAELAEVLGCVGDGGERGPNSGPGRAQRGFLERGWINRGLYQYSLILASRMGDVNLGGAA
jgi:hypothetical protein